MSPATAKVILEFFIQRYPLGIMLVGRHFYLQYYYIPPLYHTLLAYTKSHVMVAKLTPPGRLSVDTPAYPGEGWKVQYYKNTTRVIQLSIRPNGTSQQISLFIGAPANGETDEQTFKRAWDMVNYIKSHNDWRTQTQEQLYRLLMAAADTRYHLAGEPAAKYGPNGFIASRVVGGRLHRDTLNQTATAQLDLQRNNQGHSAEDHIRAIVGTPPQQLQQHLEEGDVQLDGNGITRLIQFFNSVFRHRFNALENELLNPNGTAESYKNIVSGMLPSLGGPTAGVDIQQEFNIHPLPDRCNPSNDIFFWSFTRGSPTNHIDTIKFQNVKSLMFYNAMACFKGRNCVPWDQDHVKEVILDILGDTDSKIWYISKDEYVGNDANEMGSFNIIEIPRDNIHAECHGGSDGGHSLIRGFVNNM